LSISAKAVPPVLFRTVDRRADILVAGDSIDGTAGVECKGGKHGGSLRVDITGDKQVQALHERGERDHHTRWLGRTYLAKLYKKSGYQWIPVGCGVTVLVLGTALGVELLKLKVLNKY